MPYCRKCGIKLEEGAHFCQKCGTPVITNLPTAPSNPPAPRSIKNNPVILIAIALSIVLIIGLFIVALLSASFTTVNVNQTFQDDTTNINKLNLTIQTEGAKINVITKNINNNNFVISIQGHGSKRLFSEDNESPVKVEFYNTTSNEALTITAKIVESAFFSRFNLDCTVYVNPDLTLNLNITSNAGKVSLFSDKAVTYESINLQTNAGTVEANLQNTTIEGNVVLKTNLGTVYFGLLQTTVMGNRTVNLHSNAGTATVDVTQTDTLQGNLWVIAETSLGSVNIDLNMDGDVAAKIAASTNLGNVHVNQQNFSGNQSPLQSNNYPADSNIEINCTTNLGNVNINAQYQSLSGNSIRN